MCSDCIVQLFDVVNHSLIQGTAVLLYSAIFQESVCCMFQELSFRRMINRSVEVMWLQTRGHCAGANLLCV